MTDHRTIVTGKLREALAHCVEVKHMTRGSATPNLPEIYDDVARATAHLVIALRKLETM